ncbi:MAG: hypothetical protein HZA88_00485 [Verrucomicrobia bacterium]|nr:hypothetical protein [Verrucomicrobiota bacterium]
MKITTEGTTIHFDKVEDIKVRDIPDLLHKVADVLRDDKHCKPTWKNSANSLDRLAVRIEEWCL